MFIHLKREHSKSQTSLIKYSSTESISHIFPGNLIHKSAQGKAWEMGVCVLFLCGFYYQELGCAVLEASM